MVTVAATVRSFVLWSWRRPVAMLAGEAVNVATLAIKENLTVASTRPAIWPNQTFISGFAQNPRSKKVFNYAAGWKRFTASKRITMAPPSGSVRPTVTVSIVGLAAVRQ